MRWVYIVVAVMLVLSEFAMQFEEPAAKKMKLSEFDLLGRSDVA